MSHGYAPITEWNLAWDDDEMTSYLTGNSIWGDIGIGERCVDIWQWSSEHERWGHSRRALKWLQETYGPITVVDLDRPSHRQISSWTFWAKMADEDMICIIQNTNQ